MKSVLISIRPQWCDLILAGKKTVEIRKTKPKLEVPFKCYIYKTKHGDHSGLTYSNSRVIGEFVCDKVFDICIEVSNPDDLPGYPFPCTGLTDKEILRYLGNGKTGYGWHISNLKIYTKPKTTRHFTRPHGDCGKKYAKTDCVGCPGCRILQPPQSWCYVEELP